MTVQPSAVVAVIFTVKRPFGRPFRTTGAVIRTHSGTTSGESFGVTGTRGYDGEGWGLCSDGSHLIMSNGSSVLQFRNPESFAVDSSIEVTIRGVPQDMLNELEYVEGFVYSNVWLENRILKIDPESGETVAEIDASGLLTPEEAQAADVLNGIAYRPETQHFLITGKLWPWIFEVDFVPVPQPQGVLFGAPREAERAVSLAAAAGARCAPRQRGSARRQPSRARSASLPVSRRRPPRPSRAPS